MMLKSQIIVKGFYVEITRRNSTKNKHHSPWAMETTKNELNKIYHMHTVVAHPMIHLWVYHHPVVLLAYCMKL